LATPNGLDDSTLELVDEIADLLITETENGPASVELVETVLRKRYTEDEPKTVSLARSPDS
ncbi:MAG TPA: hypothetical protein VI076_16265, partial [Actinopolymorphaceae bacterium]